MRYVSKFVLCFTRYGSYEGFKQQKRDPEHIPFSGNLSVMKMWEKCFSSFLVSELRGNSH